VQDSHGDGPYDSANHDRMQRPFAGAWAVIPGAHSPAPPP
jgi:hypothetical protein